jgi:Arc/MetJ-type ribon-helix-helix transcriptional regulator
MVKTLELAITKAANLPEAAQEQLGRELLERINTLAELRAEIDIGIRELDAGKGEPLDIEELIEQARAKHAKGR